MNRSVLPASVTCAFALALTACSGASNSSTGAASPSRAILSVASSASVTTWDPIKSFSTEVAYLANVYEPLLYAREAGQDGQVSFTPALATSWKHSADGRVWTFTLRTGVTFHDGEPLTSQAAKQSLLASAKDGGASFIWAGLDHIDTPDAQTLVVTMKKPAPVDLIASSEYGAYIVSPKGLTARTGTGPLDAGTGPYNLADYAAGKQVVLKKYDRYWGGWAGPHYDTVVVSITNEAIVQQQRLTSGQVQLADSVPLTNIAGLKDKFAVHVSPSAFSYLGFFNTTRPPLDNAAVRRALSYAMPYEDIVRVGAAGYGAPSRGPVPAGIFPFNEQVPQYHQDLDRARQLLAQAGHPGGGFPLTLTYAAENQGEARFAPIIKDAFAKVGVAVTVKPILFNQQWEQAKGDPRTAQDMFLLLYWPTYADAGNDNLNTLFHSSPKPFFNLSYWKDGAYDGLVDQAVALTQTDRAKASQLYLQAQQRLVDQAPGFFLYDQKSVSVTQKSIAGQGTNVNYPFVTFFYRLTPTS